MNRLWQKGLLIICFQQTKWAILDAVFSGPHELVIYQQGSGQITQAVATQQKQHFAANVWEIWCTLKVHTCMAWENHLSMQGKEGYTLNKSLEIT